MTAMVRVSTRSRGRRGNPQRKANAPSPLCVDLDGTLVRSDTLVESLASGMRNWRMWRALLASPFHQGTGGDEARGRRNQNPSMRPPCPTMGSFSIISVSEKGRGRKLILVTASDRATADAVNTHLQLFDKVLASDGVCNLRGEKPR